MARTDTLGNFLTDVADSIRAKTGETGTILASEFDTQIASIVASSETAEKTYFAMDDFTQINSTYTYTNNIMTCTTPASGNWGGVRLNEVKNGTYHMKLTNTANKGQLIWYMYYEDSTYMYVLCIGQGDGQEGVRYKLSKSSRSTVTIDKIVLPSTPQLNESIIIEVVDDTHVIYYNDEILVTLNGCNTLGACVDNAAGCATIPFDVFGDFYLKGSTNLNLQDKSIEITENGTVIVTPDEDYDGLENVDILVNVGSSFIAPEKGIYISKISGQGKPQEITAVGYTDDMSIINNLTSDLYTECTRIILGDTITKLPANCFQNNYYLEEIVLNSEVESVHAGWNNYGPTSTYTFGFCTNLKTIDGTKLKYILPSFFEGCSSLKDITFREDITNIPPRCFYNCSALEWTKLPEQITSLAHNLSYYSPNGNVFCGCTNLALTEIDDKVTIGNNAGSTANLFEGCENITLSKLPSSWTFIGASMFKNCKKITINDLSAVTYINNYGFYGCSSLEEIITGDNLTYLGTQAFYGCTNLKKITIKGTHSNFYQGCFQNCTSLEEVNIETNSTAIVLYSDVFRGCSSLKKLILNKVTRANNTNIFRDSGLEILCLPDIINLGYSNNTGYLFTNTNLKQVWIGSTVTTITRYAFSDIKNVIEKIYIDLPRATVEAMSNYNYAFMNDATMTGKIICNDDVEFVDKDTFINANNNVLPNEYQEVEYLESTGTQYIDTGVLPNTNTKLDLDFCYTENSTTTLLFGSRKSWNQQGFYVGTKSNVLGNMLWIEFGSSFAETDLPISDTERHTISFGNNFYYDGTLYHSFNTTLVGYKNILLFGSYEGESDGVAVPSPSRLYSCQIYDGDTLIRDFKPCYRVADNVAGLYDIINNVFYTNGGSGEFVIGT